MHNDAHNPPVIDLRENDRHIVTGILRAYLEQSTKVFLFGSRATGSARRGSDIDLAVDAGEKLPFMKLIDLQNAFEESSLSLMVDVIDLHTVSAEFRDRITPQLVRLEFTSVPGSSDSPQERAGA